MLLEPFNPTVVNRLVFCLQSDKQGIGKTTFGRKLVAPFNEGHTPSLYEMDSPDFSKDSMIQMCANVLVMLDDISNWHSGGLKRIKSIISSKNIKVRPPYGAKTISKPRSASFFATTNELGFLNEPNDTRWAIFSITDIDKSYNTIDMEQIWAEALDFARNGNTDFTEEMKKHCISLSSRHQIVTASDELISQYFEINEDSSQSAYELYECLPYDMKKLFGSGTGALSKLGKALSRVFGKSEVSYKSGGITKWRVRFKSGTYS
jgi:predicted P-loop ATPase